MYLLGSIRKIVGEGEFRSLVDEFSFKIHTLKWQRKYKEFNYYYQRRQWAEAIDEAKKGELISEADQEFYQKLAHAYKKLGQMEHAKESMRKAFNLKSTVNKKEIIRQIEEAHFCKTDQVTSTFTYLGGANNLGFIQHVEENALETTKYLTKIVSTVYPFNHFAQKEKYFHTSMLKDWPDLRKIVPEMVYCLKIPKDQIFLMTFQEVADEPLNESHLGDLIALQKRIAQSISYEEVVDVLKETDKGKAPHLSALMHQQSTHRILFRQMRNKIDNLEDSQGLEEIIERLERVVLALDLPRQIKQEDYVFSHRDFNEENILYDKKAGRYYVIDWSNYGLSLKGADAAKLLASFSLSFEEIERQYMPVVFEGLEATLLNQVLFVYELLIEWIKRMKQEQLDLKINQCILPAIEYIEEHSQELRGV